MSWELYDRIRKLKDSSIPDALALLEATRSQTIDIRSFIAIVEADCYALSGDVTKAKELLEDQINEGTDNFWVYYAIAAHYRNLGQHKQALDAYRSGHEIQGWGESKQNGYIFTHDFFSGNIPVWKEWFSNFILTTPIRCLEIGSWQGASATWLLDKIVSQRQGILTCVDTFEGSSEHQPWLDKIGAQIQDLFDHNIRASGHAALCRKLVGRSQDVLLNLIDQTYDFIYVDGAHEAKFVIQDAILSWRILRPGGYLVFDDVDFHFPATPEQDTGKAILAFTTWFADELDVVDTNRQMLIRKR